MADEWLAEPPYTNEDGVLDLNAGRFGFHPQSKTCILHVEDSKLPLDVNVCLFIHAL